MSDDSNNKAGSEDGYPEPASGPMDKPTADWYVEHTDGQFQAFQRDGHWYLHTPDQTGTEQSAAPVPSDE
jgi:hypothetical protein